ncbi:MAG TPA: CDGSH iron-sulfur domain-containing protein [Paludibaculum sp.]|jgi:CDGSH-type Zn-finger protein
MSDQKPKVVALKDGPYEVQGAVPMSWQTITTNEQGESVAWEEGDRIPAGDRAHLCRCGQSANKPFCDGSHRTVRFDGTETASRAAYLDQARTVEGPEVTLTDAKHLCAFARFCDAKGLAWKAARREGEEARGIVLDEAGNCPGGRLVAWDRDTQHAIEPAFSPSIGLVQDPAQGISGPIWVRGGIPVLAADGTPYEVRNRVALCRCGASSNKPFCDGSHASITFRDGH